MRRLGVVLALAGLALAAWPAAASADSTLSRERARELRLYDGTLLLARPGAGATLSRAGGVRIARTLPIWRLPSGAAVRVLPRLMRAGLVSEVSPDLPVHADTHLEQGDPLLAREWWVPFVGLDRAEPPGPGKPVTVIDSGIDLTHPEFASRPTTTALNEQTTSGRLEEHGTAVSSTIGAPANGIGVVGVYPQANLQVFDASHLGAGPTIGEIIQGLDAAIRHGPGVINLSLGAPFHVPPLDEMIAATFASGSFVVAASGNDREVGSPLSYPAALPHVLTVGATDSTGAPTFFTSASRYVDLAAPGQSIPVAVPATYDPTLYDFFSGTSFSSPLVAGAAAWVWTARPTLDVTQLGEVMRASAQDIAGRGFDNLSGFGRLDIPAALAAVPPATDPQEPNEDVSYVKRSGFLHRSAPPLTVAGRPRGAITAHLESAEDPRDVYRMWVPGKRTAFVALRPSGGDADLALWGPRTSSVLERGAARRKDTRGLSEHSGLKRESLRVTNTGRRGAYFYVEASAGTQRNAARTPAGIAYRLSVSIVKAKPKRAARR